MVDSVIILCAGSQERYGTELPKQLLPVDGGEPLLQRTAHQLRSGGIEPVVVAVDDQIIHACGMAGIDVFRPHRHSFTVETLFEASHLITGKQSACLLGDVFWSVETLSAFLQYGGPNRLAWCGDGSEIYGVTVERRARNGFLRCAQDICAMHKPPMGGRLQGLRSIAGGIFLQVPKEDRTQDFDVTEDYDRFLRGVTKRDPRLARNPNI
jgi:hypothetical protein